MGVRNDERIYLHGVVETTIPVMNWFLSVDTVPLVHEEDTPTHQQLIMMSLLTHFLRHPVIIGLVCEMTVTQQGYPTPFAISMAGYQASSVSFTSTPYVASVEALDVLRRIERELHILSVSYKPPRRKRIWDWLRENHYE